MKKIRVVCAGEESVKVTVFDDGVAIEKYDKTMDEFLDTLPADARIGAVCTAYPVHNDGRIATG